MKITFSPQRSDAVLSLSRSGDILTINGLALDLTDLPEGATLPREAVTCDWLAGDITRIAGQLEIPLILPHGPIPWPAPPEAAVVTHPAPVTASGDGPIPVPSWAEPETEEVSE